MKKFQTMMAVVLVALAAFVVTSCGSDDDKDNNNRYTFETSLKIDEPGNLTKEECEALIMQCKQKSSTSDRANDAAAEQATQYVAETIAEGFELDKAQGLYGDAVMTCTVECKRVSNNQRVAIYYVTYNKGDITITNGKN